MPEWKDVVAVLASLVASFSGAWAAFKFQAQQKRGEETRQNVGSGNRAIYGVYALWNVLEQFRKEVLEPFRGRPDAWLNLAAHPAPPVGVDRFQQADLQFLLEKGQASVFAAIMLEEQRFHLVMNLIQSRSQIILDDVFPRMAAAGFGVRQARPLQEVENVLGIDVCHKLREITAAMYQNIDEDLASLRELYEDLRGALQAIYPDQKYLQIVFETTNDKIAGHAV